VKRGRQNRKAVLSSRLVEDHMGAAKKGLAGDQDRIGDEGPHSTLATGDIAARARKRDDDARRCCAETSAMADKRW